MYYFQIKIVNRVILFLYTFKPRTKEPNCFQKTEYPRMSWKTIQSLPRKYTWRVSYKRQELLTLRDHLSSFSVFGGVILLTSPVFCVALWFYLLLLVFYFWSCVLCIQCCQFLWIIHSWLLLRFSLTFLTLYLPPCTYMELLILYTRKYTEVVTRTVSWEKDKRYIGKYRLNRLLSFFGKELAE